MKKREITIYDIAKELNLSASTVSRALNGHKAINEKTRAAVMQCAQKNGYRVNIFASNLRIRSTKTIGAIVPTLDSPFLSAILSSAEKFAAIKGYNLLIAQSFEDVEKEKANLKMMLDKRVDGLMVSVAQNSKNFSHYNILKQFKTPVVFFDRVVNTLDNTKFIIDNYLAAFNATKHLIEQGCKNLLHVSLNSDIQVYTDRDNGFKAACKQFGITNKTYFSAHLNIESGQFVATEIAKQEIKPDGIFFANDSAAVGCILALQQNGINVPADIAIVGFNNDYYSRIIAPKLTTVNYPAAELGTMVASHLIEQINGNLSTNVTNQVVIKSELIIRQSSTRNI